tara:strand:- start:53 stop:328 length:276 start_codon:yes stop_codon:yes gene_type:complete
MKTYPMTIEETIKKQEADEFYIGAERNDITIQDRFTAVATLDNALNWKADSEKFINCIDLLEISAHRQDSDYWVNRLENRFETLIKKAEEK